MRVSCAKVWRKATLTHLKEPSHFQLMFVLVVQLMFRLRHRHRFAIISLCWFHVQSLTERVHRVANTASKNSFPYRQLSSALLHFTLDTTEKKTHGTQKFYFSPSVISDNPTPKAASLPQKITTASAARSGKKRKKRMRKAHKNNIASE